VKDFVEIVASILTIAATIYGVWRWYSRDRGPSPDEELGVATRQSKPAMVFRNPFYWKFNDEQPFCARCYEVDGLAVHLRNSFSRVAMMWNCPQCERSYTALAHEVSLPSNMRSRK
jgi:hypothetical protein